MPAGIKAYRKVIKQNSKVNKHDCQHFESVCIRADQLKSLQRRVYTASERAGRSVSASLMECEEQTVV